MIHSILTVAIRFEHDVVQARQRARQIAELLGLDNQDQVRVATAVSELARNAFQYAGRGKVEFAVAEGEHRALQIRVSDQGPGIANLKSILDGQYTSRTGMGLGIQGVRRLMDHFQIESSPQSGTTVVIGKRFARQLSASAIPLSQIPDRLAQQDPEDPYQELQCQNQELLRTLEELETRSAQLKQLNKELEDTNRGVVALYAELDEKADDLRRASELKTRFLSNMTHEFRSPLNSILSLSRILLDRVDGELTSEQEKQLGFIRRAANDLSELVNDLLDLAKVEAGKMVVRPKDFTVHDLFGALRGMLRPLLAHNSSVNLVFDEGSDLRPLHTDEAKLSQILRNFISNALKYTEKGEVRVAASLEGEEIVFAVTDTGLGIATEDYERIFEEFVQVEGPHQKGKKGTGLGLPLSRKLAGLLNGRITVRSQLGVGSTFELAIPLHYEGGTEMLIAPEMSREPDPTRFPVLVVEDNRETTLVYEKFLKGTGFQVIPAFSVTEARAALERFCPVAIVLDVLLNNEHSWDFLTELKRNPLTHGIPVWVITMVDNPAKAMALGADDFQEKPVARDWFLSKLQPLADLQGRDTILIIDDDEVSRYILKGLLADTRYTVAQAARGIDGLALARELKPFAIFLDLAMPEMDGFEVLNRLKASPETQNIPVIIHSAKPLSSAERDLLGPQTVAILFKNHQDRKASMTHIRAALSRVEARKKHAESFQYA